MALTDYKITDGDISAHGVVSAPDKLTGTAAENKAVFDALIREAVKAKLNDLIDELVTELSGKMPAPGDYGSDGQYLMTDGAGGVSWGTAPGGGDMLKSEYDADGDGVVDAAAKLAVAHAIGGASFDGSEDVSVAEIGAAAAEHSHAAGDIDSGTLSADRLPAVPVNKGGTGATTAANARTNLGAAAASHKHAAGDIDSGTLDANRLPTVPVNKGGTGATTVAAARNALGLGNTSGALPAANGGTGETSLTNAFNALCNAATTGSSDPQDNDYFISQYASGAQDTYHRRPVKTLYNYIKGKLDSVYAALSHSHAASAISSGTLDAARIPNLDASKITGANTTLNSFSGRRIYISTGDPSGGSNGDVWIKYTA